MVRTSTSRSPRSPMEPPVEMRRWRWPFLRRMQAPAGHWQVPPLPTRPTSASPHPTPASRTDHPHPGMRPSRRGDLRRQRLFASSGRRLHRHSDRYDHGGLLTTGNGRRPSFALDSLYRETVAGPAPRGGLPAPFCRGESARTGAVDDSVKRQCRRPASSDGVICKSLGDASQASPSPRFGATVTLPERNMEASHSAADSADRPHIPVDNHTTRKAAGCRRFGASSQSLTVTGNLISEWKRSGQTADTGGVSLQ